MHYFVESSSVCMTAAPCANTRFLEEYRPFWASEGHTVSRSALAPAGCGAAARIAGAQWQLERARGLSLVHELTTPMLTRIPPRADPVRRARCVSRHHARTFPQIERYGFCNAKMSMLEMQRDHSHTEALKVQGKPPFRHLKTQKKNRSWGVQRTPQTPRSRCALAAGLCCAQAGFHPVACFCCTLWDPPSWGAREHVVNVLIAHAAFVWIGVLGEGAVW
jgi:hypothetical protein